MVLTTQLFFNVKCCFTQTFVFNTIVYGLLFSKGFQRHTNPQQVCCSNRQKWRTLKGDDEKLNDIVRLNENAGVETTAQHSLTATLKIKPFFKYVLFSFC